MLQAGVGLPVALFRLAEQVPGPLSEALLPSLARYERGVPFAACLRRVGQRVPLGRLGPILRLLCTSYESGLAILPLLDRALPVLEAERRCSERVRDLRRGAAAQILVVSVIPWLILAFLVTVHPAALPAATGSQGRLALMCALGLELAGALVVWRASRFP